MKTLLPASLHYLFIACPASWVLTIIQRLISATAATPIWQHTSAFIKTLAQKTVAATLTKLTFMGLWQVEQPLLTRAPVFPIRVIDVEKTVGSTHGNVVFTKPTSWEFHTISHTWSKGVQSWSNIIARKIVEQSAAGAAEAGYNDMFRGEDFRWHECYAPFMEFLRLLRADGVKQVWLDALCINQESESGEKSQELQNMGSYYANSLGCYVCAHGFGEGFETWKEKESELVMPRWFNRVWTFQEMLLPKALTFILDIHPVIRRTINWCISQQAARGINSACQCAMGMWQFPQPPYPYSDDEEVEDVEDEDAVCSGVDEHRPKEVRKQRRIEIRCGNLPCSQCGGAALIRRANDLELMCQQWPDGMPPDLHFIDRQCIVRLMIMAKGELQRTVWKKRDENTEWNLLRLETVMQQKDAEEEEKSLQGGDGVHADHGWDPIQVLVEVSKRDCTHDEDRILSILGLLKLEGAVQLRAGKTLDAQLLHLAQQLTQANPTALLKLCAAQFAGHGRPGMSWAPSIGAQGGLRPTGEEAPRAQSWHKLRRDKHMYARQVEVEEAIESGLQQLGRVMRHFVKSVQVRRVMEDGALLLCDAQVLWECSFDRVDENLFNLHLTSASTIHQLSFPFKAYFTPSSCLLHHSVIVAGPVTTLAHQSIARLEGTQLQRRLQAFRVCLVLLGQLQLPNDEKHEVMMVCLGKKHDGLLHKVGLAWLPGLEELLSTAHPCICSIGGFEDYMDRFVFH